MRLQTQDLLPSILFTFLTSTSKAQSVIDNLSFGLTTPISSNGQQIAGWHVGFEGPAPPILSDRIILTPPHPGHMRSGLWSANSLTTDSFSADFGFRASGPERGSGNLQLWFTKESIPASELRSIYTVDRFEGMVITIDQYAGSGGSVRGFLSDGTIDYKSHHNVDSLAFGHCYYAYRNLGRWSNIKIKQDNEGLEVKMDDSVCFKSSIIKFPSGYKFGISAASAETPDSFEVNKFVVSSTNPQKQTPHHEGTQSAAPGHDNYMQHPTGQGSYSSSGGFDTGAQHHELLNRLQSLSSQLSDTYREMSALDKRHMERHEELKSAVAAAPSVPQSQIAAMDRRIQIIEGVVSKTLREVEGRDYKDSLSSLQKAVKDTQADLMRSLPQSMSAIVTTSAPKLWTFVFVILTFQGLLAGAYVVYKRRRANSPKKLL